MKYTKRYYTTHAPSYSTERFKVVIEWLKSIKKPSSILDVGCGDGSCLKHIFKNTGIKKLSGSDQSDLYIKLARKKLKAEFFLDDIINTKISKKFDVVTVIALLHHLIGTTRKDSEELSKKTIRSCIKMLNHDGSLIIMEPVFSNKIAMDLLFYVKKFFSKISNNRISIFGYWNNLGAPVVSYFSRTSLIRLIAKSC